MSLTLVTFKKSGARKNIRLQPGETLIGRRPECNLRIPRIEVSRNHCRITDNGNQTTIQDLGSSNGTYVNSERIMEAVIQAGDVIAIGHTIFTVQINGKPENITPPDPSEVLAATHRDSSPDDQTQMQMAVDPGSSAQADPLVQTDPFDDIANMLMADDDDEDEDLKGYED